VNAVLPKLVLTPALIALATIAGRRWGPLVGGWFTGFPLTSGPVSVFLALEQGPEFTAQAAAGTLLGLVSATAFSVTYRVTAPRAGWRASAGLGLAAFAAATLLLSRLTLGAPAAFGVICLVLTACLALLRERRVSPAALPAPPAWDIPARMVTATAMVVTLTSLAPRLGPALSGLVSPFPVFALTMAVFAHRSEGPAAAGEVLWGLLIGSFAFATFFLVVALALATHGILWTYLAAVLASVAVNAVSLILSQRPPRPP
jgi:hypothetical protein